MIATQLGPEGPSPELARYEAALKELTDTLSPPLATAQRESTTQPPSMSSVTQAALGPSARVSSLDQESAFAAESQLMQAAVSMMEMNQVFNLQYLMLQQKMQRGEQAVHDAVQPDEEQARHSEECALEPEVKDRLSWVHNPQANRPSEARLHNLGPVERVTIDDEMRWARSNVLAPAAPPVRGSRLRRRGR